jgi:hypothetical protein
MPSWINEVCVDAICGTCLGFVKGTFGLSFFTTEEVEEINSLKKLALSVMEKSSDTVTDPIICEAIRKGQKSGLEAFAKNASPEIVAAGVVTAAELVCTKSFKQRFATVLAGACLNIVGC